MRRAYLILLIILIFMSCVQKPEDGTWEFGGLDGINIYHLVISDSYLYACTGPDGLWKKNIEDTNSEWQYLGMADSTLINSYRGVKDAIINPKNTNEILVIFDPISTSKHQIYKTINGGLTWIPTDSSLSYSEAGYTVYPPLRALALYPDYIIGAGSGTYITEDFGNTWSNESITPQIWAQSCILRQNNKVKKRIWLGGHTEYDSPVLASSNDGGFTWRYYYPSEYGFAGNYISSVRDIAFNSEDSNTVYIAVGNKFIKTIDNGNSWVTINDSLYSRIIISDPFNKNHFWSIGSIFTESIDEGNTWYEIETPILVNIWEMIFDESAKKLYFGTENGVFVYNGK